MKRFIYEKNGNEIIDLNKYVYSEWDDSVDIYVEDDYFINFYKNIKKKDILIQDDYISTFVDGDDMVKTDMYGMMSRQKYFLEYYGGKSNIVEVWRKQDNETYKRIWRN